jgi:hypothetical protein
MLYWTSSSKSNASGVRSSSISLSPKSSSIEALINPESSWGCNGGSTGLEGGGDICIVGGDEPGGSPEPGGAGVRAVLLERSTPGEVMADSGNGAVAVESV